MRYALINLDHMFDDKQIRFVSITLPLFFFSPTNNGRKITVVSDEKMHIMQQVPAIQDSLKRKSLQPIFCRALGSKTRP